MAPGPYAMYSWGENSSRSTVGLVHGVKSRSANPAPLDASEVRFYAKVMYQGGEADDDAEHSSMLFVDGWGHARRLDRGETAMDASSWGPCLCPWAALMLGSHFHWQARDDRQKLPYCGP